MNLSATETLMMPVFVFLLMLGMGATLSVNSFLQLLKRMALFVMMTTTHKESMMKTRKLILALCLVTGLAGCANMSDTERRTGTGAGIGAAGGALIAGLTHGNILGGAAIGAAVGAASGYLYDRHEKAEGN